MLDTGHVEEAYRRLESWAASDADFKDRHHCAHCGGKSLLQQYMVTDDVWAAAGMNHKGFLHLYCLEKRLDRRLTIDDFTDVPINDELRFGYTLGTRFGVLGNR
jgi:hypothetical protein